jgi:hypothetical protein
MKRGGILTTLATAATSAAMAVIPISRATNFPAFGIAGKWTTIAAVAPQSYGTSEASPRNFGGCVKETMSPWVTGYVPDTAGSFVDTPAIGAAIAVCGAARPHFQVQTPIGAADLEGSAAPAIVEYERSSGATVERPDESQA